MKVNVSVVAWLTVAIVVAVVGLAFWAGGWIIGFIALGCWQLLIAGVATLLAIPTALLGAELVDPEKEAPAAPPVRGYGPGEIEIERLGEPFGTFGGEPMHERIRSTRPGEAPLELAFSRTVRDGEMVTKPPGRWLIVPPGLLYVEPEPEAGAPSEDASR